MINYDVYLRDKPLEHRLLYLLIQEYGEELGIAQEVTEDGIRYRNKGHIVDKEAVLKRLARYVTNPERLERDRILINSGACTIMNSPHSDAFYRVLLFIQINQSIFFFTKIN